LPTEPAPGASGQPRPCCGANYARLAGARRPTTPPACSASRRRSA